MGVESPSLKRVGKPSLFHAVGYLKRIWKDICTNTIYYCLDVLSKLISVCLYYISMATSGRLDVHVCGASVDSTVILCFLCYRCSCTRAAVHAIKQVWTIVWDKRHGLRGQSVFYALLCYGHAALEKQNSSACLCTNHSRNVHDSNITCTFSARNVHVVHMMYM